MSVLSPEIDDLEDDGLDDAIDPDKQLDVLKSLRGKTRAMAKEIKRLKPFEEVATKTTLDKAFEAAGLKDLDAPKRTALLAVAGEARDVDTLKAQAVALGWAVDPNLAATQAARGDQAIANATAGSGEHVGGSTPTLKEQIAAAEKAALASGARKDWNTVGELKAMTIPGYVDPTKQT